ncbi:MAG: hypothetical protein ACO23H_17385 [Alphaproteobacteria bacterium]
MKPNVGGSVGSNTVKLPQTAEEFGKLLLRQAVGLDPNPNKLSAHRVLQLARQAQSDPTFIEQYFRELDPVPGLPNIVFPSDPKQETSGSMLVPEQKDPGEGLYNPPTQKGEGLFGGLPTEPDSPTPLPTEPEPMPLPPEPEPKGSMPLPLQPEPPTLLPPEPEPEPLPDLQGGGPPDIAPPTSFDPDRRLYSSGFFNPGGPYRTALATMPSEQLNLFMQQQALPFGGLPSQPTPDLQPDPQPQPLPPQPYSIKQNPSTGIMGELLRLMNMQQGK